MSKSLAYVASACAKNSKALDAATKVLTAVGVSLKPTTVDSVSAADGPTFLAGPLSKAEVAKLGNKLNAAMHSTTTVTAPSAAINPDATFADAKYGLVRGNVSGIFDGSGGVSGLPIKDLVDYGPSCGFTVSPFEAAQVKFSVAATAKEACALATQKELARITLLQKPLTALKEINALYAAALQAEAEKAVSAAAPKGLKVDVLTSSQTVNAAVMFSKTLGVVVAPDYSAADAFEGLTVGIGGGLGMVAQKHSGTVLGPKASSLKASAAAGVAAADADATAFNVLDSGDATAELEAGTGGGTVSVYAQASGSSPDKFDPASNPTGLLFAAAGALKEAGSAAEAAKIEAALAKVYGSKAALPSDVAGGKADAAAFADAVVKAL